MHMMNFGILTKLSHALIHSLSSVTLNGNDFMTKDCYFIDFTIENGC